MPPGIQEWEIELNTYRDYGERHMESRPCSVLVEWARVSFQKMVLLVWRVLGDC